MRLDSEILLADLTSPAVLHPVPWAPAPEKFLRWLEEAGVPAELVDFCRKQAPTKYAQLGTGGLLPCSHIMREHKQQPELLPAGFLCIGSSSNGDMIVMDVRDVIGAVGYISHELLWSDQGRQSSDRRAMYRLVSPTLGMFVRGLLRNAVPMDYYWTWCADDDDDEDE